MFNRNVLGLRNSIIYIQRRSTHRHASHVLSQFSSLAADESSKYQVYLSTADDPYLNLSIEHHLLQTTPSDSTVLFLYANRPCVVIGRNQNPWLETNLRRLSLPTHIASRPIEGNVDRDDFTSSPTCVELVRRRSGGGTVFHGPGNVNYSIICPSERFTRDMHAEMVAKALQGMNPTAHVNQRHDIVLTPNEHAQISTLEGLPSEASPSDPSSAAVDASALPVTRKVSGSAFKLTRGRALHHGTCLLCTPHLGALSNFLASPARGFLHARGVDSVRSSVANVLPPATDMVHLSRNIDAFYAVVLRAFADLYPAASLSRPDIRSILDANERASQSSRNADTDGAQDAEMLSLHAHTIAGVLGPGLAHLPSISQGVTELRSEAWLFGQTPRFTLTSIPPQSTGEVPTDASLENSNPALMRTAAPSLPTGVRVYLEARNGVVTGAAISTDPPLDELDNENSLKQLQDAAVREDNPSGSLGHGLKGKKLFRMGAQEWVEAMEGVDIGRAARDQRQDGNGDGVSSDMEHNQMKKEVGKWFSNMLPLPQGEW